MRIAVCVKPVPDPKTSKNVTIDPVTKTIRRDQSDSVINPLDRNALEAALVIREKMGGEVIVVSMAPPTATTVLREALALGADKAYLLSDRAFGGGDSLATANVLSAGLRKVAESGKWDLILFGSYSADGGTSQVPAQVGELLGVPHFHFLTELECEGDGSGGAKFTLAADEGRCQEKWRARSPLVLSVTRKLNKPRYTTVRGIMKAKNKEIVTLCSTDVDADREFCGLCGSPTQNGEVYEVTMARAGERIGGTKDEVVAILLDRLASFGVTVGKGGAR